MLWKIFVNMCQKNFIWLVYINQDILNRYLNFKVILVYYRFCLLKYILFSNDICNWWPHLSLHSYSLHDSMHKGPVNVSFYYLSNSLELNETSWCYLQHGNSWKFRNFTKVKARKSVPFFLLNNTKWTLFSCQPISSFSSIYL